MRQIQATTLPSTAQMTVRIQAAESSSCRRQPISATHCPPVSPQPRHAQTPRPQTHTLLMTRHPNHPNRPTNDRRTSDQHTIGTQQHVRACTDMQERFPHSHPCKPLSWLQQTTARLSRHSPGMHSGTGSHTPAESSPATNSHSAHDATPKPPQQTNQ